MVEVNEQVQGARDQIAVLGEKKKSGIPVSFCLPGFALLSFTEKRYVFYHHIIHITSGALLVSLSETNLELNKLRIEIACLRQRKHIVMLHTAISRNSSVVNGKNFL